ncbi:rab-like protein 3 isoform X1 [Daphnia carinata]|uniref:rab-like protein 3 isoform X1 n=1 Tax=Daphnia carinata TaxID=120202 RepID=UPI00257FFD82|nr:rab-like protein 3 isoform X1 [Daphnia carinata]
MASIDIDKVRIIVIGDSGVGKTSLIHTLCHGEPIVNPSWTIGCSVDVKLHEYREGTSAQKTYFVELWDVGGSSGHKNTRSVFFTPAHGIILVHDLTNRKSEGNLRKWLAEVLTKECNGNTLSSVRINPTRNQEIDEYDPEQFIGSSQIPILVVGTKLDLAEEVRTHFNRRLSPIAEECGAGEIFVDCTTAKAMAPGSSSAVKLSRFFDLVIEKRFYNRDRPSPFTDKRRLMSGYSGNAINHKVFHFE